MSDVFIQEKLLEGWLSNSRFVVVHGGRGSAKSTGAGKLCTLYASQNQSSRVLCIRGTQSKLSESSMQIIKEEISNMGLDELFNITENTIKGKNGSEFLFYGAKTYQSFKSLQGVNLVWIDEATELSKEAWDVLLPSIREEDSRFLITFNPEKESDWVYKTFIVDGYPNTYVCQINYYDNPYFPWELQQLMEYDKSHNQLKYEHIWMGKLQTNITGALFKSDWFVYEPIDYKECDKIMIAIDPSGSNKTTSDACGIIVIGKKGNIYYVLDDMTKIASPLEWASTAVALYYKYEANGVLYESNYGGDIVKTVIRQIDKTVPVKEVRATRGKLIRAEPVAALYEQGLVKHVKHFKDLEYEMITFDNSPGQRSPNRLDACVYGVMSLEKKEIATQKNMNFRF